MGTETNNWWRSGYFKHLIFSIAYKVMMFWSCFDCLLPLHCALMWYTSPTINNSSCGTVLMCLSWYVSTVYKCMKIPLKAPVLPVFACAFVSSLSCIICFMFQSRRDAQKALAKHGQQLNSVLIIGVKQVDPWQRQYLNDSTNENYHGGVSAPFPSQAVAPSGFATRNALAPLPSNAMQHGSCNKISRGASGAIASPAKSVLSKVMDLMFGL